AGTSVVAAIVGETSVARAQLPCSGKPPRIHMKTLAQNQLLTSWLRLRRPSNREFSQSLANTLASGTRKTV
ncbi:MAG: hypothetical protein NTY01_06995, partial [Verrucomicrobia bacterium]|nr:hypothetical protein [Verrucomicrobiota bacterium]